MDDPGHRTNSVMLPDMSRCRRGGGTSKQHVPTRRWRPVSRRQPNLWLDEEIWGFLDRPTMKPPRIIAAPIISLADPAGLSKQVGIRPLAPRRQADTGFLITTGSSRARAGWRSSRRSLGRSTAPTRWWAALGRKPPVYRSASPSQRTAAISPNSRNRRNVGRAGRRFSRGFVRVGARLGADTHSDGPGRSNDHGLDDRARCVHPFKPANC